MENDTQNPKNAKDAEKTSTSIAGKPELKWISTKKLHLLSRNPQYVNKRQMQSLGESIKRDGFAVPILVRMMERDDDYEIISGNHRFLAAREVGIDEVPCVVMVLDDKKAKRMAINLNTIHGEPNAELLAPFLAELDNENLALIHLEDLMRIGISEFSEELAARMQSLDVPTSLDRKSPTSPLPNCVCSKCGKHHVRNA